MTKAFLRMSLLIALIPVAACEPGALSNNPNGNSPNPGGEDAVQVSADALPDFLLTDVNANSTRLAEAVSPRDYLGQVSAWYFGHST